MTETKAELLLASKNAATGRILYTFKLTFPRIILAEVNTHRMASKNTSSSRAVPVAKQIERVLNDPFVPVWWGKAQPGMQAFEEVDADIKHEAIQIWLQARNCMVSFAQDLLELGLHKQIPNRLLEPFMWTEQIFSATDLNNLDALRNHEMAEPHFQILAKSIRAIRIDVEEAFRNGWEFDPEWVGDIQTLQPGDWHLPLITQDELRAAHHPFVREEVEAFERLKKISAARCAWVSFYMPGQSKMIDLAAADRTFDKLVADDPKHLSPFEHQARAMVQDYYCANFRSFMQYRKEFPNEDGGDRK
jgi:hypothetical protein